MKRTAPLTWLQGLACAAALACGTATAADPVAEHGDPQARKLLDEVAKAYKALTSYADEGQFVQSMTINGKVQKENLPMHLTLERPNKFSLDAGLVRAASDGKTMTTAVTPSKKYTVTPAPKNITFETFREGPLSSVLFGGPGAPTNYILLNLLAGEEPVKAILDLDGALKLEPERKNDAGGSLSLLLDMPKGPDFRMQIDPATKLLKSIDWVFDAKELADSLPKGQKIAIEHIGWTAGKVSTKTPAADAFAFQAPKGFTKVESFARSAKDEDEKYPVMELVGKPAPEFTLTVLDGEGKTKTLSRDDLAGKVVLLDFWATWCPPCLAELPEVQKLVEAYDKDKKDVLIVALSQDQKPRELAEVRKLVEETLKEKKVTLTGTKVGLIALDPSGSIGDAFSVQAIPTIVLLDGKGVVQAAYVGLQTRQTLSKAIDTLLEGKSLAKPKPEEAAAKGDDKKKD